jgi:hypothetical protein
MKSMIQPVPFRFPAGAVVGVNLDPEVTTAAGRKLASLGTTTN